MKLLNRMLSIYELRMRQKSTVARERTLIITSENYGGSWAHAYHYISLFQNKQIENRHLKFENMK